MALKIMNSLITIQTLASMDTGDIIQQDMSPQFGVTMQQRILCINIHHTHVAVTIALAQEMFYF